MSKKERYPVSQDFVDQCSEVLTEFGAVRRSSFLRFIELNLDVKEDVAERIAERMAARGDVIFSKYADITVVKASDKGRASHGYLDAFEAYIHILGNETADNEESTEKRKGKITAYASKAAFPADFLIYVTTGIIYNVFVYDQKNMAQKVGIFEKNNKKTEGQITMIVFPAGTDLDNVRIPKISGKYRFAVVRKSSSGNAICRISEVKEAS